MSVIFRVKMARPWMRALHWRMWLDAGAPADTAIALLDDAELLS